MLESENQFPPRVGMVPLKMLPYLTLSPSLSTWFLGFKILLAWENDCLWLVEMGSVQHAVAAAALADEIKTPFYVLTCCIHGPAQRFIIRPFFFN